MQKRIGDRTEKYLVAKMTERQKRIAQLKAGIYSLSIDDLVINAIDNYPVSPIKCNQCGSLTASSNKTHECQIKISNKDVTITITNYPHLMCNCDDKWLHLDTLKYLEDLLHFEILERLRNKEIPDKIQIDFYELIKM